MLLTYFDFHSPFISVETLLFSSSISSSSSFHTYNSVFAVFLYLVAPTAAVTAATCCLSFL